MHPLEILIALFIALCFLRSAIWSRHRPRWTDFLLAAAFLVTVLHFIIEGYRWQMVPLYALNLGVLLFSSPQLLRPSEYPPRRCWLIMTAAVLGVLLTALATALPVLFPVPHFIKPTGPLSVGTFSMMRTDTSRKEIYSGNPDEPRRIMTQIWHPADLTTDKKTAPWMEHAEIIAPAIARYLKLPLFFLNHL